MSKRRLEQFGFSLLIVLSLLVSSVSASCLCFHHLEAVNQAKVETEETSCHHGHQAQAPDNISADTADGPSVGESDCCCAAPAPRVFTRNENLKIEKPVVAIQPVTPIEVSVVVQIVPIKAIDFEPPFYLSDSFYNLAPSRGPPSL